LQRAEELLAKNAGTAVARDQAQASDQQAQGAILMDEANLKTAQINLGYTDITSPIAGKVGRTSITRGNVVSPQAGPLTTIVSQDPMYVTFPVSQRDFQRAKDTPNVDVESIKVQLRFADGTTYKEIGRINFIDVSVDRSTDTVLLRATFPNPGSQLLDGQLVRVNLESGTPVERIVIPQAALIADQQGVYVFVVENDKAVVKRVRPGSESGVDIVIQEGLSGGELVVVEGLQSLRPGAAVRAAPIQPLAGRSASTCHRYSDRNNDRRCARVSRYSRGAISGHRTAAGAGLDHVSGGELRRCRGDRRPAHRGAGDRRRQDDLHEEHQRR
jgi:membrane fusion protein (multidrug efflux system)